MELSEIVREYRKENEISQRKFAAICELSNGYISMLEKNVNPKTGLPIIPSITAMKKIAKGIGISLKDLLAKTDDIFMEFPVTLEEKQKTSIVNKDNGRSKEFMQLFELLTEEQQTLVIQQIKGILSNQ